MTWTPGLIVLGVGLVVGLLLMRRLRAKGTPGRGLDLDLRISDLEARRDDLYRRLREIDDGDAAAADRTALEGAAARCLKELDELQGEFKKRHPKLARERKKDDDAAETSQAPASPAKVFVTGFAYGAGLLLLIGGLIYYAVRDAKPRADGQPITGSTPQGMESPHPDLEGLTPQIAQKVSSLQQHLEGQPDDLNAHKELGYTYLGASRFVEAFRQGEEVLSRAPEDPDGLYMQGVVRLTMGQVDIAQELLGRALEADPAHADSLTASGIILLRMGDYAGAIGYWQRSLASLGGSHPMVERLISMAEAGRPAEEILGLSPPDPAEASAPASAPAPAPAAPAATADAVTLTLELAPGASPPPGGILFVTYRGSGPGPPAAVKRIDRPRFPMTFTLSAADSMLGRPLPESGSVTARIDRDGSASTRDPDDLGASAEAGLGDVLTLRLTPGG